MPYDFLKKYQGELITEKIQLKEDLDLLNTKISEEKKFYNILVESNKQYFSEFSPRNLNQKNNEKAAEIKDLLDKYISDQKQLDKKMNFLDVRLKEISDLLLLKDTNPVNANQSDDSNVSEDSSYLGSNDIIVKLNELKNTILLDPYRASIEIDTIIDSLKNS